MPSLVRGVLLAVSVSALACGSGGSSPARGPSAPSPTPPSSASNPCTAALAGSLPAASASSVPAKGHGGLGVDVRDPRDFLWLHRLPRGGDGVTARAAQTAAARVGDIAVLPDDGGLIIAANPLDLGGAGLRFELNGSGGYDVRRVSAAFRSDLGRRVPLADDDTSEESFASSFSFYGTPRTSAFVNSDGNLTFGESDTATSDRSLGRALSGPPRVAAFFADLDPSAGGGVFVSAAPDAFTVTWCAVPGFESPNKVTAQASLLADGAVEIRLDASTTLREAVVALSPGAAGAFAALDLSAPGPSPGGSSAVGERFAAEASLDLVAAAQRFYAEFPDAYDQILFWTDTRVTDENTFAFETTVNNAIEGIGQEILDLGSDYGSAGRLQSVVVMDNLGKYPSDPASLVPRLGQDTSLSLLAHESGHRWGATLLFQDANGEVSDLLLGRQRAHWSFFFDSDASVLEGNDIEDRGGGSFLTVGAVKRYGPLDLYAMGLISESEVPPVFYVADPSGTGRDRESAPSTGVTFTGTRREVTIADIVAAMGPRRPSTGRAPRGHRQAWVYVVGRGRAADPAALNKLERFRRDFEPFFEAATEGRMRLETRID